jgi:hypothetical protein
MILQDKGNIKLIQKFLSNNWQKNHIISKEIKILNWLHYNKFEKKYNFVLEKKKNILGFLGIIKNSKFSKKLKKLDSIWLTTWVAKKEELGVGIKLLNHSIENYDYCKIGTVGCNESVKNIYKYLGFITGNLTQYYIPNLKIKNYKLIKLQKNFRKKNIDISLPLSSTLNEVTRINFDKFKNFKKKYIKIFAKDEDYFINKYIKNPFYKYIVFEFKIKEKLIGYYFARESFNKNNKCLRIVDFFGNVNNIFDSSKLFKDIIEMNNYEFVDIYFFGKKDNKSYFIENKYNKKTIIPNHFEPFIKKNIILNFAILKKKNFKLYLFKGDCDQERPNIINY